MQRSADVPRSHEAFKAIFIRSSSRVDDDACSTSAGSSDCGSSSSPSTSPCSVSVSPKSHPKRKGEQSTVLHLSMLPPGLAPPPGLVHPTIPPPPGFEDVRESIPKLNSPTSGPPPGLAMPEYTPKSFRKELTAILKELASSRNVAAAVRRVRIQKVPRSRQSAEFTDVLTRASEEHRGIARRLMFAFAAGLTAGESSAFETAECIAGLRTFFTEVYDDLCEEVPRLPVMVRGELVPVLCSVLKDELLMEVVPKHLHGEMSKHN